MRPNLPSFLRAVLRWVWVPVVAFVLVVAVAMGCAVWSPVSEKWKDFDRRALGDRNLPEILRESNADFIFENATKGRGVSFYHVMISTLKRNSAGVIEPQHDVHFGRAGFPFRCLRWAFEVPAISKEPSIWVGGIKTGYPYGKTLFLRRLPLLPEPVGMLLNILIASAFIVLVRLMTSREVAEGDGDEPPCDECGKSIKENMEACSKFGAARPQFARARPEQKKHELMRLLYPSSTRFCIMWVCVLIASGVLVVTVAMLCAVWSPIREHETLFGSLEFSETKLPLALRQYASDPVDHVRGGYSLNSTGGYAVTGPGVSHYRILMHESGLAGNPSAFQNHVIHVGRAGFPFRCLRWTDDSRVATGQSSLLARGIETQKTVPLLNFTRRVPLTPEPVGMTLNVLIVSTASCLLLALIRRGVMSARQRRGLCTNCAYPVEPSARICPECGESYAGSASEEPSHA